MPELSGHLDGAGLRVAVVISRFNAAVCDRLLEGALSRLRKRGVAEDAIDIVAVPGAFEIPFAVHVLQARAQHDAIVTLGAVVRGETPHFDFVAGEAARGVNEANCRGSIPVAFGVLTTDTMIQAVERSGGNAGNKGAEAADVAIEMARLAEALRGGTR